MSLTPTIPIVPTVRVRTKTSTNLPGQNIAVTITTIQTFPLVYEVTASVGQTTFTQRHTTGATSGSGPALTPVTLATTVDGYAQSVADLAALQESYRALDAALA